MGVWSGWQDLWSLMSGVLGVTMVVLARLERAVLSKPVRKLNCGFTLIELMVTVAVLAILLAIAMPNFSSQIRSGRTEAAAQGLARAVASARATASQTGRRTTLLVNGSAKCGTDSSVAVAWRIAQGDTVVSCLSKADFSSRYEGSVFANEAASTGSITFLPTGIATNTGVLSFGFVSGSTTKTVTINAGGTANVL